MTMTRPCLRMIRHLLQIFFTLGLTFIAGSPQALGAGLAGPCTVSSLLVPVDNPPAAEVVGAELHDDSVVGQDPDVVHPHLAADVSQDFVPVVQLHPEERVRERLHDRSLDLDGAVFLGHALRASLLVLTSLLLPAS